MSIIKVLLLLAILLSAVVAFRGGQSAVHRALWRLGGVIVVVAAALSVLFPDALTTIANGVGVDRGADLLLYALVVTFLLVVVILFRRVTELEQRIVTLVRAVAIEQTTASDEPDATSQHTAPGHDA